MAEATRRGPGRPPGAKPAGREALLRAARELMNERGLPRLTAREVAERAGVQPALVNYYFGSREGLVRAVVEEIAGRLQRRMRETVAAGGSFHERFRRLIHGMIDALAEDPYGPRLVIEQVLFAEAEVIDDFVERFARPNLAVLTQLLAEGRAAGLCRQIHPAQLVPMLTGMGVFYFLSAPIRDRLFPELAGREDLHREFAEAAAEVFMHGIASAEGSST